MRKIRTLYVRDQTSHTVLPTVTAGSEWVEAGEGHATRKWDGTCCLVDRGVLYRRATVKPHRPSPPGFELVEIDLATGKRFGWAPLEPGKAGDPYREGWAELHFAGSGVAADGTYELVGPKINGNPDRFGSHQLVRHGWNRPEDLEALAGCPRSYSQLADYLCRQHPDWEGVVFHHPDGRMAKIKGRDFPIHSLALAA
jgi:hypothetical protein